MFKNAIDKIKKKIVTEEEMKELIFQKAYFINTIEDYPNLNYDAVCLNLISEYHCLLNIHLLNLIIINIILKKKK